MLNIDDYTETLVILLTFGGTVICYKSLGRLSTRTYFKKVSCPLI